MNEFQLIGFVQEIEFGLERTLVDGDHLVGLVALSKDALDADQLEARLAVGLHRLLGVL